MTDIRTFLLLCGLISVPGIAGAADMQTSPIEQNKPSPTAMDKQNFNVGQRDSQKEKPHGVWLDFYENKKISIGCGITLLPQESLLRGGQGGNSGGPGFDAGKVQGCLGFKYSFR
ncbi:MAG TPA: hypothetical protein VFG19_06745 [Geobacteraceae bacterium]|nr:hypothetical protein [Geobacteraceae bacterium]